MPDLDVACHLETLDGHERLVIRVPVRDAIYDDPPALQRVVQQIVTQVFAEANDNDSRIMLVPQVEPICVRAIVPV